MQPQHEDGDGMAGFDADLRAAVGRTAKPCTEANPALGLRCDRMAHSPEEMHIQYGPNGADAWGFTLEGGTDGAES